MNKLPSNTFCILPWMHINVWPNGDAHHCCLGDWKNPMGNLRDGTPDDIVNNDAYKKLRLQLLSGEKPKSCMRCFEREDVGISSMRNHHNEYFESSITGAIDNTQLDGTVDNFKFEYWDFRFSNLCNMKCRMCGSGFSSMWYDDEIELSKQNDKLWPVYAQRRVMNAQDAADFNTKAWIDEKINDVKYVYFAGGEPLIMDEHYYILQQLIDAGRTDVRIRYNTNLLKLHFKHYDLVEMWSKFDFVQVNASIDDIGARAEYIRAGTVWNDIENNLQRLTNTSVKLLIDCTTQAMNVLTLPDLYARLRELGIPANRIMLHNILQQPESFNVKILSHELKNKAKQGLYDYANVLPEHEKTVMLQQIAPLIEFMYTDTHTDENSLREHFKVKQTALDALRKENFTDVFPHLEEWYNGILV